MRFNSFEQQSLIKISYYLHIVRVLIGVLLFAIFSGTESIGFVERVLFNNNRFQFQTLEVVTKLSLEF